MILCGWEGKWGPGITRMSCHSISQHTKAISKSCFYHIHALKQICDSVDDTTLLTTDATPYLTGLLHRHNPRRALQSSSANVLSVARSNLSFGSRAFRTAAPTVWNSLPPHVRSCTTLTTSVNIKNHIRFNPPFPLTSDPSQRLWSICDLGAI